MTRSISTRSSNRSCLVYSAIIFIAIPLLLIGAAIALLAGRDGAARRRLNEKIAEIEAQGLPTSSATMQAYYESLTSKETTATWLEIQETLQSQAFRDSITGVPIFDPTNESEIPLPGGTWTEETVTRDFLNQWEDTTSQIVQLALDGKPVRFPIIWDSISTNLDMTQQMRSAGRLVQVSTQTAIFDRDSAKTREGIEALFGCGDVLSGEPIIVSQLISLAFDSMAVDSLKKALEANVLNQEDLESLLATVRPGQVISPGWRLGLIGERAMMLEIFDDPATLGDVVGGTLLPFRSTDANNYMDLLEQALNTPTEDFDEFLIGLDEQEEALQALTSSSIFGQLDAILTGLLNARSLIGRQSIRPQRQPAATG